MKKIEIKNGFIIEKYGVSIKLNSITSFVYDELLKYTEIHVYSSVYKIADSDKEFYNLLIENI